MPRVVFTSNLRRHVASAESVVSGETVRKALNAVFADHRELRSYIVDDQNRLRTHLAIFVDGRPIRDRITLNDPLHPTSEVYVMQALSGG